MSHSKRNTSRPVFTSHERALAKSNWTSSSARLNRDSFLPFGSCGLCLEIARDPVSCPRGDIFCRECALANLVAQKRELKRADRLRQDADLESARIRALDDDEERARAIRDFELTQAGLNGTVKRRKIEADSDPRPGPAPKNEETALIEAAPGNKRKFALDDDELSRIAREDKAKARKAIEDEKAAKPSLPSFWTPSLTPDVHDSKLAASTKKVKTTPTCPSSAEDNPHALSMQKLVTIQFDEEEDDVTKTKRRSCPSCRKVLSNSNSPVMAKQCGHVLCHNCVKQFLVPSGKAPVPDPDVPIACYVCDVPLSSAPPKADAPKGALPPGLVLLKSEGTGFSARGGSTVERSGVAFQC